MLISDLKRLYRAHAVEYYRDPSSMIDIVDAAMKRWTVPKDAQADKFKPADLKAYREHLIRCGLSRSTINLYIGRIVEVFRWGAEEGHVQPDVYLALKSVKALQAGRSKAKEYEKVRSVDVETVQATMRYLPLIARDLVDLQLLTAARSGELLELRPCDVDQTGDVWTATVLHHKGSSRGQVRVLYFGPQAQEVMAPYMRGLRKEPMFRYSTRTYWAAIQRACARAGVDPWHPHQLRHTAATEIRATMGPEASQVYLGHAHLNTTEIYAERNSKLAAQVAERR